MSAPEKTPELPIGYHVENLMTLLQGVMEQYEDLLNEDEHLLYHGFNSLSRSARSLFCRLLTRQGRVLREDKLNYADIPDLAYTLDELEDKQLCQRNHQVPNSELLNLLTRVELVHCFRLQNHSKLKKPELIQRIEAEFSQQDIGQMIQSGFPYVEARYQNAFETYKVCFFGNSHQDLTEFVISDLGHVQYEQYSLCRESRYFQTREQIDNQTLYSTARQRLEDKALLQDGDQLLALAQALPIPDHHPHLQRRYQKTLLPIARQLERLERLDEALALFQRCERHPSRERQARILKKQGQLEQALDQCQFILGHSQHPEEQEFVQRFLPQLMRAMGNKPPPRQPNHWHETQLILANSGDPVEWLTAEALSDDAHLCCYVENTLFNGLFGLFFWDIIFASVPGAFINPFQRAPLDLSSEDFYLHRRENIDARLNQLETGDWQRTILQHYQSKQGLANAFVFWDALPLDLLKMALARIPPLHLQAIFQRILQHAGLYRNGFPDLIRFSADRYELIEVKGPGDKLQANQIRWLNVFQQVGIPASVCWVTWEQRSHD